MRKYDVAALQEATKAHTPDTIKARIYYLLTQEVALENVEKAKPYLQEAVRLSKENDFLSDVSSFYTAYIIWDTDPAKSEALFLQTEKKLSRYATQEAYFLRAKSWRNYGIHRAVHDSKKEFLDAVLQAIPLAEKSNDSTFIGLLHQDVGMVFMNNAEYLKANEYLETAIVYMKATGVPYTNIAEAYYMAIKNYTFQQEDRVNARAKELLDEERKLLTNKPISVFNAEYYLVEGMYYNNVKQYEQSINSYDKGIRIAKQLQLPRTVEQLTYQKYFTYTNQGQHQKALAVLKDYLAGNPVLSIHDRMLVYHNLSTTYAKTGNILEAYNWLRQYTTINDSVHKIRLREEMSAMELKFKTSEKEREIQKLQAEKKQASLQTKNQKLTNLILAVASAFLLLNVFFLLFYYRNSKRLAREKEVNYLQQLKDVKQQQELNLAQAMLNGEERERQRVARDLHDGLGGMLAGVKIDLSRKVKLNDNLNVAIERIDGAVTELRRIARNMMPESLLKMGLEQAVQDLCEQLMSKETQIEFQPYSIDTHLPVTIQTNIYRIIQEILSNAIRHAQAKKIIVQCSQNEHIFFITVEDDGRGFDIESIKDGDGFGLKSIRDRVAYLKGSLEVHSVINEGTSINIEIDVTG